MKNIGHEILHSWQRTTRMQNFQIIWTVGGEGVWTKNLEKGNPGTILFHNIFAYKVIRDLIIR